MTVQDLVPPFLSALAAAGLGAAAGSAVLPLVRRMGRLRAPKRGKAEKAPPALRRLFQGGKGEELPAWARRWLERSYRDLRRAGLGLSFARYAALVAFGALVGFAVGVVWLHNLPAAVLIAASAYLVPDMLLRGRLQAAKARKIGQLGAAVRVFAAEFRDTPQAPRALDAAARRIPPPLGDALREAADMAVGKGKSPDEVCSYLMRELDFEYGRMFALLLRAAWDDAAAGPLFTRLAARVAGLQGLMQKNRANLAYSRLIALAVNALVLPAALGMRFLVPETGWFLVHHPAGRLLVCLAFLSVLVGLALDRLMGEVEV